MEKKNSRRFVEPLSGVSLEVIQFFVFGPARYGVYLPYDALFLCKLFLSLFAHFGFWNESVSHAERQCWSVQRRYENGFISVGNGLYGYNRIT